LLLRSKRILNNSKNSASVIQSLCSRGAGYL
jgi:hypothetical protein